MRSSIRLIHKEAIDIAAAYDRGDLFTPPSERGTIVVPGVGGGGNWNGAAIDPETGTLYVGTVRLPFVVTIRKPRPFEGSYDFIGEIRYLSGPRGLPLLKPPFGSMVAINMNSGEHRWRIPVGDSKAMAPIRNLGIQERLGLPRPQLGAGDKDRPLRGRWDTLGRARIGASDQRPQQPRSAYVGLRDR